MTTREMANKIIELRSEAYDLRQTIDEAVYNYIKSHYGLASCNDAASADLIGKACKEECHWSFDETDDVISISFSTFKNGYGDLSNNETRVDVDPGIIDKYYNV